MRLRLSETSSDVGGGSSRDPVPTEHQAKAQRLGEELAKDEMEGHEGHVRLPKHGQRLLRCRGSDFH